MDKESSSDVTLQEGANTILSCRAAGRPTPRIVWRREDGDHIILRNDSEATKGQNQICNIRVKRSVSVIIPSVMEAPLASLTISWPTLYLIRSLYNREMKYIFCLTKFMESLQVSRKTYEE